MVEENDPRQVLRIHHHGSVAHGGVTLVDRCSFLSVVVEKLSLGAHLGRRSTPVDCEKTLRTGLRGKDAEGGLQLLWLRGSTRNIGFASGVGCACVCSRCQCWSVADD